MYKIIKVIFEYFTCYNFNMNYYIKYVSIMWIDVAVRTSVFYFSMSQNEYDEYIKHLLLTVLILRQRNLVFYVCDRNILNIFL
jgi:hypothetical protein